MRQKRRNTWYLLVSNKYGSRWNVVIAGIYAAKKPILILILVSYRGSVRVCGTPTCKLARVQRVKFKACSNTLNLESRKESWSEMNTGLCKVCNTGATENVNHFMFECNSYTAPPRQKGPNWHIDYFEIITFFRSARSLRSASRKATFFPL